MNLELLKVFVDEMQNSSSTNAKKEVLKKYVDNEYLKKVLNYTYHPFKQFYVTSSNLLKRSDLSKEGYSDLFVLLDDLNDRKITGHEALAYTNGFIAKNKSYQDLILQVIDRNLKTRATETIINSVIPDCIPVFKVQLAEKYSDFADRVDFENDEWYGSYKLDGCRCTTIIDFAGNIISTSRNGKEFTTLGKVHDELKTLGLRGVVLDGEICINTDDGRDDFNGIMKEIGRKNHSITRPKYYLFDLIPYDVFFGSKENNELFSVRMQKLYDSPLGDSNLTTIAILPQFPLWDLNSMDSLLKEALAAGREGLIIKRNTPYQGKRTKDIMKVKIMHDAEYVVTGLDSELNRVIRNGKEVEIMMLSAVFIEHKGERVRVGSGFSQEEKINFYNNPDQIVGKVITVQYQEESKDQNGKFSLRFPVFKVLHGDKRTV